MSEPMEYSEAQAARILDVSERTLRRWRQAGKVAHYVSPAGRRVRYLINDLLNLRYTMRRDVGRICPDKSGD